MIKGNLAAIWLFLFLLAGMKLMATHNRAGEINYEFTHPNTLQATITTYTKASSVSADRDTLFIRWGDGSPDEALLRTNGPVGPSGVANGVDIGNNIKKNIYIGIHTYPGAPPPPNNFYIISMTDPNRNAGISNINNSVDVPFYLEDTIFYPTNVQNIGFNHSPIMLFPPIDFASVGDTFFHNPAAYDPDGDSLDFIQIVPKQGLGQDVPGYRPPSSSFFGGPSVETLDRHTGQYMWATPQTEGIFNVAFIVREYRRGYLLGTIIRDMQIIVGPGNTHPPTIIPPMDTCIRAGDRLRLNVTANDFDPTRVVTLSAFGGPLSDRSVFPDSLSPATFATAPGNPALGTFSWNTVCLDIRSQPYEVVFKAQNNFSTPLTDLNPWLIDVIAPPPLNLQADIVNKKVLLHWNQYLCSSIHTFRGFSIWKRVGSNPFVPAYCETGLAGRGYTKIADKIFDTTFVDKDAVGGQQLCYRILAHFSQKSPNGLYEYDVNVSVPSNEDCIYLPYDVPVITNASVSETNPTAGKMFVAWTKPRTGGTNLDTIISPPPYRFDLYRGNGFNFTAPRLINSVTRNSFAALVDTTYEDVNINTQDSAFSYQVYFYSSSDTVGTTSQASSVYLNLFPSDTKMRLKWNYNVPWIQDSFEIFRRDFTSGGLFNYIGTATVNSYIDTGLVNDSTYCYYVRAYSHYTSTLIKAPLVDSSQIKCDVPVDTIPPCPPTVSVTNDCSNPSCDTCFSYQNNLSWINYTDSCGFNTVKYRIYHAPDTGAVKLIDSVIGIGNTTYTHVLDNSLAGCYVVTAVDKRGNESYKINGVCIDDCPNYELPNTFTPNGDGANDTFTPLHPYRFITHVEFKIFTRWGEKVYETTDPEIRWDGKDQKSGKDLSDGVYLYSGYYFEQTLHGEVRKPLPHKKGGGFIHLLRGK